MAEEMFKTTLMGGFDKDDVQEKVQKLLEKALSYGGKDNVTIILCEIGEEIR